MRATNGFPGILPLPARAAYLDVSPSRAISHYLSVVASLPFIRSHSFPPPSLSVFVFLSFSLSISVVAVISFSFVLSYSGGFSASRFVYTHTLDPQKPLDCEFLGWKRRM